MKLHIVGDGGTRTKLTDGQGNSLDGLRVTRLCVNWDVGELPRCELEATMPSVDLVCEGDITRIRTTDGKIYLVLRELGNEQGQQA